MGENPLAGALQSRDERDHERRAERSFHCTVEQLEITTAAAGYGYRRCSNGWRNTPARPKNASSAATGTSMANHLAMAAVLAAGDEVLIEQPAYGPLLDVAEYLGARVKRIARKFETGFALDPEEVEKAITPETRLIVLTNLHNPSGALMPVETTARDRRDGAACGRACPGR